MRSDKPRKPRMPAKALSGSLAKPVSVTQVLELGSPNEIKILIRHMSDAINSTSIPLLFDVEREWLGSALRSISNGMDANVALQLKAFPGRARRTGVIKDLNLIHQVESLKDQGISETRALGIIASENVREMQYERLLINGEDEIEARKHADELTADSVIGETTVEEMACTEAERLKKQLQNAKKKLPGKAK